MVTQGKYSSLSIDDHTITITRKERFQPMRTKTIPISKITAITFQPNRFGQAFGYMLFSIQGGKEPRSGTMAAAMSDNAVFFNRKQEKDFLQAKEYIERIIGSI